MTIPLTPKSIGLYFLLAAFLVLMLFFSMGLLPKGTATESEETIVSHTPATQDDGKHQPGEEHRGAKENQISEASDVPPDKTVQQLVQTWNGGKVEDIAGLFMPDGTLIMPTGSQLQSRAEIQKTISEKRGGVLKETTLTNTVDEVTRPDANTALVQGTYRLEGIKILGVSTSSTGSYKIRQVKRDGRWLISRAEVIGREKD